MRMGWVWLALAAVVLLASGSWLQQHGDNSGRTEAASAGAADAPGVDRRKREPTTRSAKSPEAEAETSAPAVFPAPDQPLRLAITALETRAHAGEVPAMTRLVSELERCASAAQSALSRSDDEQCRIRLHCDGVATQRFVQRWDWLFRAASAGDARAQLVFAQGVAMYRSDPLRAADWLPTWRKHALAWVQAQVEQGSPDAMLAYARALSVADDDGRAAPLATLVDHDREQAYALQYALSLSPLQRARPALNWERWSAFVAPRMDADGLARARRQGELLYARFRARLDTEALTGEFNRLGSAAEHQDFLDGLVARYPQCGAGR